MRIIVYLCIDNTALLSYHRGCSKDKVRSTLVLRPSTILYLSGGGGATSTQLCPDVCVEGLKKDPFRKTCLV